MEMPGYGKHGKPRSRLSTLPTLLGNPFGITTFPRPRLLAYFKVQKHERPNPRQLDLKGVVTQVLGPKCNERSSTLTRKRRTTHGGSNCNPAITWLFTSPGIAANTILKRPATNRELSRKWSWWSLTSTGENYAVLAFRSLWRTQADSGNAKSKLHQAKPKM